MRSSTDALCYSKVKVASGMICACRKRLAGRAERVCHPPHSSKPRTFTAVTTLGKVNGKTFKALGSMTWGYSVSKNGAITLSAPRVASRSERAASIAVLKRDSPLWTIGP